MVSTGYGAVTITSITSTSFLRPAILNHSQVRVTGLMFVVLELEIVNPGGSGCIWKFHFWGVSDACEI